MDKPTVMGEAVSLRAREAARNFIGSWPRVSVPTYYEPALAESFARFERELALWVTVHCPTCGQRFVPPYYPKEEPDLSANKDETIAKLREALDRLLSWWPEGSERSQVGRLKGSAFADDLVFARALTSTKKEG